MGINKTIEGGVKIKGNNMDRYKFIVGLVIGISVGIVVGIVVMGMIFSASRGMQSPEERSLRNYTAMKERCAELGFGIKDNHTNELSREQYFICDFK